MLRLIRCLLLVWLAAGAGQVKAGQDQQPTQEENYEFFSGTVIDALEDKLTVARTILGKPEERRTFLITAETKVEGKVTAKARVTVGFRPTEEGDVAVRIIVRPQQDK